MINNKKKAGLFFIGKCFFQSLKIAHPYPQAVLKCE